MKWTTKEVEEMLNYLKDGLTYSDISIIMNRSNRSIRSKLNTLGEKSSLYKKDNNIDVKCVECGYIFNDLKYLNRKFCSKSCSNSFSNRNRKVENYCLECKSLLSKKSNKYCSNKCQVLYSTNKIFESIEQGNTTFCSNLYKKYLIYKFGNKCMECGWCEINKITNKVPVQLEHIDGNSENNSLYNLKLLCPNCHSLTPTYGALNKGNGRKNRKR